MLKKSVLLTILFLTFGITETYAGWYKCYNYKGTIGKHPITLSIQITEDYFGEKDKKEFNLNGVYKYDKYNNPIKLEGILKNNKIQLYEIYNDKNTAVLEFNFSENKLIGTWKNLQNKKILPLELKYTSSLNDTSDVHTFENVEILQLNSLKDYYFIGVYSKTKDDQRVRMKELKIINKQNDLVFQVLNFNNLEYAVGNVVTIIYQNIEVNDFINKKLDIWCDVGRMGGWFTINYHKNKFISNYKLNIDGQN
ncbi:hypothetical protein [Aquimarina sp. I32.4]|uniref:hypothetical protein n=1 Tax=Aquimarina sp. I32.4 TaxID=2053903 RepID=UPI000CDE9BAC|nr:hypothetical protein [Aquimarina sp. I32.4]